MNDDSILGKSLGQLGDIAKKTGQQAVKIPADVVEDLSEQVGVTTEPPSQDTRVTPIQNDSERDTKEFVKGLYAKSEDVQKGEDKKEPKGQPEFQKMIANKPLEEKKKLLQLHQQLHQQLHKQTYYDPTFNPPKKQEPRPAEKIEEEKKEKKQMEALEFEEKKKKELSITVKQGTHEKVPGISG